MISSQNDWSRRLTLKLNGTVTFSSYRQRHSRNVFFDRNNCQVLQVVELHGHNQPFSRSAFATSCSGKIQVFVLCLISAAAGGPI